jgi:hypothetical protein
MAFLAVFGDWTRADCWSVYGRLRGGARFAAGVGHVLPSPILLLLLAAGNVAPMWACGT